MLFASASAALAFAGATWAVDPLNRRAMSHLSESLFPAPGGAQRASDTSPESRGARMASLLGALVEATESADDTRDLLREASPMLLAPFEEGSEGYGSVYGDAGASLDDKVEAYEAAMSERIQKAQKSGGEAQARALSNMLLHVLDELGFEQTPDDARNPDEDDSSDIASPRRGSDVRMAAPNDLSWFVKTESFVSSKSFPEIKPHLEAHKVWVAGLRAEGVTVTSGYRVDAQGRPGGGGLMFFAAVDHEAAEAFVLQDPLVANGCVDWQVNGWIADVGDVELVDGGAWLQKS